ncbi:MAG: GNAT family N-acetyltransferase, partial [Bacteroidia bacterium]|nr:GNAT family N-acetyltransferase [Bacteroidia bacterium]
DLIDTRTSTAFLLSDSEKSLGFVLVGLRIDYVEGATTNPVCYIEGIYIEPDYRRHGYARLLIKEAEKWGKDMNCSQIASDAEINNLTSIEFHKGMGFKEANRVVCFIKDLDSSDHDQHHLIH